MKKILKEIYTDSKGKLSSKRIFGSIGFITAIVLIGFKIDTNSLNALLITSASLLGLGVGEGLINKFKK